MIETHPAHPFEWIEQPWGMALRSGRLADIADHFFTTRDVDLRGPRAAEGWHRVASSVGVPADRLARLKQVHGTAAIVIRAGDAFTVSDDEAARPHADIVMTDDPSMAVAVQVADCVPVLLADRVTGAVAAVHAGWRGTAAGAVRQAVSAMRTHFKSRAADLVAAVGPSIGPCCYQVGSDVVAAFSAAHFSREDIARWFRPDHEDGRFRLDVARANVDQLRSAGVRFDNIHACDLCTACHPPLFHSYRRDGAHTGRLAAVIRPR